MRELQEVPLSALAQLAGGCGCVRPLVDFVVLSALADRHAPQRIVTGTIRESEAGEWLSVAAYTTDPKGFPIALRETTTYEGSPAVVKPGAHVTVWYRSVGDRRFVADKVRVLAGPATP